MPFLMIIFKKGCPFTYIYELKFYKNNDIPWSPFLIVTKVFFFSRQAMKAGFDHKDPVRSLPGKQN